MFQSIKYEDKREVFGFKIHSFSTLDRIKKYDDSDNEENAEALFYQGWRNKKDDKSIRYRFYENSSYRINQYQTRVFPLWTSGFDFYTKPHNQKNFSICFNAVDYALKIGYNVLKHTIEEKNTSGLM